MVVRYTNNDDVILLEQLVHRAFAFCSSFQILKVGKNYLLAIIDNDRLIRAMIGTMGNME